MTTVIKITLKKIQYTCKVLEKCSCTRICTEKKVVGLTKYLVLYNYQINVLIRVTKFLLSLQYFV